MSLWQGFDRVYMEEEKGWSSSWGWWMYGNWDPVDIKVEEFLDNGGYKWEERSLMKKMILESTVMIFNILTLWTIRKK